MLMMWRILLEKVDAFLGQGYKCRGNRGPRNDFHVSFSASTAPDFGGIPSYAM